MNAHANGVAVGAAGKRVLSSGLRGGLVMRKWSLAMIVAAAALAGPRALAQPSAAPTSGSDAQKPRIEYEKKTVINFEDDTIEGDLKKPDSEYVDARRKVDHSNLIKLRDSWRDKVMQASGDL